MPNWFVGFPAPSPSLLAGLSGAPAPLAALAVDDLHLTVAFLGAVDTDAALRAWSEASGRRIPPFELTFGEPAWLGHPNHPSALALRPLEGVSIVEDVMRRIRHPIQAAAGAPLEDRAPLAHVTIARLPRRASDTERAQAEAWSRSHVWPACRVEVAELALYVGGAATEPGRRYRIDQRMRLG